MSQFYNRSPFPGELVDHTEAELDFILEMYAADHPDKYAFHRGKPPISEAVRRAAWDSVLTGQAREGIVPQLPLAAIRAFNAGLASTLKTIAAQSDA